MTVPLRAMAFAEDRTAAREEVHHRARAYGPDAKPFHVLIANISGRGLMVRCDTQYAVGDRLTIALPVLGATTAVIRWSLGGRLGCEFDIPVAPGDYYELLAALRG